MQVIFFPKCPFPAWSAILYSFVQRISKLEDVFKMYKMLSLEFDSPSPQCRCGAELDLV